MDPYLERAEIWPDFHDRLITHLCEGLQPLLRPKYVALGRDRLYVIESERPIWPDVALIRTPSARQDRGNVAVCEEDIDAPAVFELWRDELREPFIEIVEPAAGNRVVTAIEVLSPTNKVADGRQQYLAKREEYWQSGTNLVEIDLLRDGEPTVRIGQDRLATLQPWKYLVAVTRRQPSRQEVYAVPLTKRLPRIAIPLGPRDRDVPLDLQAIVSRCWEAGPYPELLNYDGPPPGPLTAEESAWCQEIARKAFQTAEGSTGPGVST